jgi:hypothetical protein
VELDGSTLCVYEKGCQAVSDLFADFPAEEGGDGRVFADDVGDGFGLVHDEGLLHEGDFGEELAHAAFDHFLGDFLRLAAFNCLLDAELAFLLDNILGDLVGGDRQRTRNSGGHMHADLAEGIFVDGALSLDEDSGLAVVVDILAKGGGAGFTEELVGPGDGDIFAGGDAEVVNEGDGVAFDGDFAGAMGVEGGFGDLLGGFDELVVLGGEIGLGPELDDGGGSGVEVDSDGDSSFASGAIHSLVHLSFELLAHEFFSSVNITACFGECFFAGHHGQAGAVAKAHHIFGTDWRGHFVSPSS